MAEARIEEHPILGVQEKEKKLPSFLTEKK